MKVIGAAREVVRIAREDNLPFMAASVAFYAIASVLPPAHHRPRGALGRRRDRPPGRGAPVEPLVEWVLLQVVFFYYSGSAGSYAAYGFFGAVLLFVTFLYPGAVVLLVGAALDVVLEAGPAVTRTPTRATAGSDDL